MASAVGGHDADTRGERREAALSIDVLHALHAFPCYTSMLSMLSSHIVVNHDLVLLVPLLRLARHAPSTGRVRSALGDNVCRARRAFKSF